MPAFIPFHCSDTPVQHCCNDGRTGRLTPNWKEGTQVRHNPPIASWKANFSWLGDTSCNAFNHISNIFSRNCASNVLTSRQEQYVLPIGWLLLTELQFYSRNDITLVHWAYKRGFHMTSIYIHCNNHVPNKHQPNWLPMQPKSLAAKPQ